MTTISVRDAVLNVAWAMRWVKETQGSNRGEVVDEMVRLTGLNPANRYPWCACYVAWVGYAALRKAWPLPKVAGCMSLKDAAYAKGMLETEPAVGAVFLIWGKAGDGVTRFKHTGFLRRDLSGGLWETVEGNTNAGGSPEGTGVFVRQRRFSRDDRFIHWWGTNP